ncbi:MAG: DUF4382 domain-containing protein [Desulfuromonadales bacterium]
MTTHFKKSRSFEKMLLALLLLSSLMTSACTQDSITSAGVGTGGTGSLSAVAKLDITDAHAGDYAHVYVTITGVAFHLDDTAVFSGYTTGKMAGWQITKLPVPRTVDLAMLSNGTMYADLNGNESLFSNITLPIGKYRQLRIFLASTEEAYVGSASGLTYNNEVQLNGDTAHYPLRIPSWSEGIKVLPESPVEVISVSNVRLALDFNLNNDVVSISPNASSEFMLKPRLGFFDMANVGAITGTISFRNLSSSGIEIKAEQVKSGAAGYRVVRRITGVDKSNGAFTLYPLPVFGNATTATYDILIRGHKVQTAIVKRVTVHHNTTPAHSTALGTVALQQGTEFTAQLGSVMHPSGAWLNFYQKISGDPIPFEILYHHLNPYTGKFSSPVELSTGPVQVATYAPGTDPAFTQDSTAQGEYTVIADAAFLYERGAPLAGIGGKAGQAVSMPVNTSTSPQVPTSGRLDLLFDMALLGVGMGPGMGHGVPVGIPTKGQIFITHGGMIMDSIGELTGDTTVASAMNSGGMPRSGVILNNIPGNLPGAVYGIYALGWGNGFLAAGNAFGVDLRAGNATTVIKMR